jgi:hypothetical protein
LASSAVSSSFFSSGFFSSASSFLPRREPKMLERLRDWERDLAVSFFSSLGAGVSSPSLGAAVSSSFFSSGFLAATAATATGLVSFSSSAL